MLDKEISVSLGAKNIYWRHIRISQYDTLWRFIFTIYDGDDVYTVPSGATVLLIGRKSDETVFTYSGEPSDENVVVVCGEQVTSYPGSVECELRIAEPDGLVSSANFILDVEASPISGFVLSENDFSALDRITNRALESASRIGTVEEALEYIKSAVSSPLVASTASGMTDHDKVYVYTGSEAGYTEGNWYYWDGLAWTSGGVYNAVAVNTDNTLSVANMAADAKKTGDEVSGLKSAIVTGKTFAQSDLIRGSYNNQMQPTSNNANIRVEKVLDVLAGQTLHFVPGTVIGQMTVGYFSTSGTFIKGSSWYSNEMTITFDCDYKIILVFRKDSSTTITTSSYDATTTLNANFGALKDSVSAMGNTIGYYGAITFQKTQSSHSGLNDRVFCDIPSGSKFYIKFKRPTTNWIYFYGYDSSDQNPLGSSLTSTNSAEGMLLVTAPFNIKSIGLGDSSSNTGSFYFAVYADNAVSIVAPEALSVAESATQKIEDLIIGGEGENLYSEPTAEVGYLNSSGGIGKDQPNNRTTDFIPVDDNEYITMQTWMQLPTGVAHWQAFCFYNSQKTLVGSRSVLTGGTNSYAVYTVSIPSNVTYVRASTRAYNDYKIKVQFGNVPTAYTHSQDDISHVLKRGLIGSSNDTYVKSVSHRGWSDAPENTIPAFVEARQHGFNFVECDIAFTSDGVPVLLHDDTINRTARNADGSTISSTVSISDITYAQALEYDFGIYKGEKYAGTKIPTLSEFLTTCKRLGLRPYIEIKTNYDLTEAQIEEIVDVVAEFDMLSQVTFISFSFYYLRAVKNYNGSVRLGRITSYLTDEVISSAEEGVLLLKTDSNEVFVDSSDYSSTAIALCKSYGLPLEIWTINSSSTIQSMNLYISGVTSDSLIASSILENQS